MAAALRIAVVTGAVFAALAATPASAQFKCDAPSHSEWMTPGLQWNEKAPQIPRGRIVEIEPAMVTEAVRILDSAKAVPLDQAGVSKFLGKGHLPPPEAGLSPFLVRAVYPTASPVLSATLLDGVLRISAGGLGCSPFLKHPVVIYLERAPVTIEVSADAAL
jgi:hypothetical protein